MKSFAVGVLSACVLAAAPSAVRACAAFQVSGSDLSLRYDPFNPSPVERTFTLRIQRLDASAAAVRFILVDADTAGGARRIGSGPDGYEIRSVRDASRPLFFSGAEQPNAANGLVTPFAGAGAQVATEVLRLSIPAGRSTAAGDYFEPLEVRYSCQDAEGRFGPAEFQQGVQVGIDLRVAESLSTFIGSPGVRRGQIAFGRLAPGQGSVTRNLAITTQSTVPYDLEIKRRFGRLQRREDDEYGLDYALRLEGRPVSDGAVVACSRTPVPAGRSHELEVSLDQARAAQVPAGSYGDTVTLNFTPRVGLSGAEGCLIAR